jgi:hypothetical protein
VSNPVSDHLAWFKRLGPKIDRLARRAAALSSRSAPDALRPSSRRRWRGQIIREMVARYESRQQLSFHFADSEEMPMGAAKLDRNERASHEINQVFQGSTNGRARSGT